MKRDRIFQIPLIYNLNVIEKKDYTINDLRVILKHYKLKVTGNKSNLIERLNVFFKENYSILQIQRYFRGYLIRLFFSLKNKYGKDISECSNSSDFYDLENIEDINPLNMYFYIDNNVKYIFKLTSLIEYFKTGNNKNPYNRQNFKNDMMESIFSIVKLNNILNIIPFEEEEDNKNLSDYDKIKMKAIDLFQDINLLGNYSEFEWFLNLNRSQTHRFIRELEDIWNYRSQITDDTKKLIYPPSGDPFINERIDRHDDILELKATSLNIINKFVNTASDDSNKSLGAIYVLSALTLVSYNAAISLPWLYESVAL
jgi:hypothetical protein